MVTYLGNGYIGRRIGVPQRPIVMVLLPIIEKDGLQPGLDALSRLRRENPAEHNWGESDLNALGYALMNRHRLSDALAVFELNVKMNPDSSNAYDSLAEAHLNAGNRAAAITNYEKSLRLNPRNENAAEQLRKLRRD